MKMIKQFLKREMENLQETEPETEAGTEPETKSGKASKNPAPGAPQQMQKFGGSGPANIAPRAKGNQSQPRKKSAI